MNYKMNQEVKALWLQALRSGEYEQTANSLHNQSGYCCLGVLCDLAVKAGVIESRVVNLFEEGYYFECFDGETAGLTDTVQEWSGVRDALGEIPEIRVEHHSGDSHFTTGKLSSLNDSAGWTFEQIADYIEENL